MLACYFATVYRKEHRLYYILFNTNLHTFQQCKGLFVLKSILDEKIYSR